MLGWRATCSTRTRQSTPAYDDLVSGTFSNARVDALRPRIEELVDELLDEIAAGAATDDPSSTLSVNSPSHYRLQ